VNEIDILTNAGLSRTHAEFVVALNAMATALGEVYAAQQQQQQGQPAPQQETTAAEAVSGEVLDEPA
jgi:hypothetical protein